MPKWKYKIQFHDLADACKAKEISLNDFCLKLTQRLKEHSAFKDENEMQEFSLDFENAANNKELNEEELDELIDDFYNYADEDNRLWLE